MVDEMLPFERLTRALTNLSNADLQRLLKAVDGLMATKSTQPAFDGQIFRAEGTFYKEPSEQHLSLDEMLRLIQTFNPAELQVLSQLVPYYFDRARHSNGQRVSASWGTTNLHARYSSTVWGTAPDGVSLGDLNQRAELFKSFMALLQPAQDAKAAGDFSKASALLDQAISLLRAQGISEPELQRLRALFHK